MRRRHIYIYVVCSLLLAACSTTRRLPEGEYLYTGVKRIEAVAADTLPVPGEVQAAVNATLEVPPNAALLGSAYHRFPPVGLWLYNWLYTERETGLRHWLWNTFKSDPVLLSQVNPPLRVKAARLAMADEGYFGGEVECDTVFSRRRPREARLAYTLRYPHVKRLSDVRFMPSPSPEVDSLIRATSGASLLVPGRRFSAAALEGEKARIADLLHAHGYYYYKPQYLRLLADSTLTPDGISLRVYLEPAEAGRDLRRAVVDSVAYTLDYGGGLPPTAFDTLGFMTIGYRGRLWMRPAVLRRQVPFRRGAPYHPQLATTTKARLARLNVFRYTDVAYEALPAVPGDTLSHLLMRIAATYSPPWTSALEFRALTKDNHQTGPGMSLQLQRRNLFGGGELLAAELTAGYEWATGHRAYASSDGLLNSYEFGLKTSLTIPKLDLPRRLVRVDRTYPTSTTYSLSAGTTRRSGFFQMMRAAAEVRYDFYTTATRQHSIAPLKLAYTHLVHTSARFDSIAAQNRVLQQSFANQFIPKLEYTYTYDNRSRRSRLAQQWLQVTLAEAGGLVDAFLGVVGNRRPQGRRQLMWQPFSQFLKATADLRNYLQLTPRLTLATRLYGGIVYAYGNSDVVPFSEQFYIGGAGSLRGFSIRSLGPGSFAPGAGPYGYMDQTGDVKLEAGAELRFPLLGDLKGALFADAGNIWTLRSEASRPGGQFRGDRFWREIATDVGLGLRYDLGMLVVRFDVGIPLHDPTEGTVPYYNVRGAFLRNLGYHLAVGYPF